MATAKRHDAVFETKRVKVEDERVVLTLTLTEASELRDSLGSLSTSYEVYRLLGQMDLRPSVASAES